MQLLSDIRRDGQHQKQEPGSYEWWYFDGISDDEEYQIVIIFYDGCPFSTRYIRSLDAWGKSNGHAGAHGDGNVENTDGSQSPDEMEAGENSSRVVNSIDENILPVRHPVLNISVYHRGEPVFESMCQYPTEQCSFETGLTAVTIGGNSFRFDEREKHGANEYGSFDLRVNELLPSGIELKGIITFTGMNPNEKLFPDNKGASGSGLYWNLAMPAGRLSCRMNLIKDQLIKKEIKFDGTGYHDHQMGRESMKNRYRDWYRGRAHFPQATLVYYVMNGLDGKQEVRAWLISPDNRRMLHSLSLVSLKSTRVNKFLMRFSRRLLFRDGLVEISVLHHKVIDSGPFSCRFISSVSLSHPSTGSASVQATGEYFRPGRIHRRIFWPFYHRRLRFTDKNQS